MDNLEETRLRLESQVNEFFSPVTPNERKQQIGPLLENFSKEAGSWKQALYFLSRPETFSNAYLSMFCITVIENSVKGKWLVMEASEKSELHSTLYNFLIGHASASSTTKCPHFVRNKVVKILTDVGKFSWPHDHPTFFDTVLKITANDNTVMIGLLFLKTISEEWPVVKDEVSTDRKIELKIRLIRELDKVFDLLYQILATGLKHYPSAASFPNTSTSSSSGSSIMPPGLHEIIVLALQTVSHYFTWIPFDGSIAQHSSSSSELPMDKFVPFTPELVNVLCQYAGSDITGEVNNADGVENLSILALGALNELLYRKYMPKELDRHVNLVTSFAVDLLCKMYSGIVNKTITHKYLDKGIELLCLIANSYFFRYDKETSKRFIAVLLNFTFAHTETVFYYECLEIWKILLDHLVSEVPFANFSCREELLDNFKPILLDLSLGIVNSTTKFDVDDSFSEDFYGDEDDEDVEVLSLSKNVDVLVKIGELLPAESLERVTSTWNTSCQYFENLQSKLDHTKTVIMLENQTDIKHFSFVIQLIGRIAEIFYGDVFKNEIDRGKALMHQLMNLSMISKNLYFVRTSDSLVQANCEIIYALRTWTYWLGRYYQEEILTLSDGAADAQSFFEILTVSADGLRYALDNNASIHPNLVLANANFFCLLVNCIRTPHIFKLPWVQTLINQIHSLRPQVQQDTFRVLNKSVSILLLLPWQNCTNVEQEWESRTGLYNEYMKNVMGEILASANNSEVPKLLLLIRILNDQLELLQTECAVSKKICWAVFLEIVPFMHKLVPVYIKRPDVSEEILNFFLKVMEVLRQQAGAQFFEETVQIFLGLFASANIINDLMEESDSSCIVVEKFIKMLEFMIKDPSPSFKKFLPDCLSVALDHIYPVLAKRSSPDVKLVFFQFIRDAVNYRWNYFFPGFLYAAPSASGSPSSVSEEDAEISRRLYQIFETLGQSFLQSDLEVFRFNLNTFSIWNQKHQIYSRMVIDLKLFDGFLCVLIQVLASKSHDLLKDEISFNLYEMSLVDFARFWQVFLPQTLAKDFPLLSSDQRLSLAGKFKPKESTNTTTSNIGGGNHPVGGLIRSSSSSSGAEKIDLTGFTMALHRFIDDLRFYHFFDECRKANGTIIMDPSKQQQNVGLPQ